MQLVVCPYVPLKIWQESFRFLECCLKSTRARDGRRNWAEILYTMEKGQGRGKRAIRVGVVIVRTVHTRTHTYTHSTHTNG